MRFVILLINLISITAVNSCCRWRKKPGPQEQIRAFTQSFTQNSMKYIPFDPSDIQGLIDHILTQKLKFVSSMLILTKGGSDEETAEIFCGWFNKFKETSLDSLENLPRFDSLRDKIDDMTFMIIHRDMHFTAQMRNGKVFLIKYDGNGFVDVQGANIYDVLTESMEFSKHIAPMLDDSFPYLDAFTRAYGKFASQSDVQEGELIDDDEIVLYDHTLTPVDRIGDIELSSNPFLKLLPYRNIGILRTTVDGVKVLVRIKGYNNKPILEYVRPTASGQALVGVGPKEAKSYFTSNPIVV